MKREMRIFPREEQQWPKTRYTIALIDDHDEQRVAEIIQGYRERHGDPGRITFSSPLPPSDHSTRWAMDVRFGL